MTAAPRFAVPRDDRRDCALYRVMVVHPVTGKVVLGYIGETGRMPFTRFMEHLYDQPWGDTIVGHPHVDPRVFAGKAQVLAAEQAAVIAEKPLYNIKYQKGAPHQIPQWTAREQRAERDRRRGAATPDWAAKKAVRIDPVVPVVPSRVWPRVKAVLRSRWTWWLAAWTLSTVVAWQVFGWAADKTGHDLTVPDRLLDAAVTGPALWAAARLWWWASGQRRWRRWKRRR